MSRRKPRFEIVRTKAGWVARFIGANGKTVWVTESLRSRANALRAIELITGYRPARQYGDGLEVYVASAVDPDGLLEVREVDER